RAGAREEFAALERFQGREIERVVFVEPGPFSEDTLIQVTETQPSRCNLLGLPICIPFTSIGREEHRLDLGALRCDVVGLESFYRGSGYYGTTVIPVVQSVGEDVEVDVVVDLGDLVVLTSFDVRAQAG